MKKDNLLNLPQYLKAISDSNRLAILTSLKRGPLCACEIHPKIKLSQNLSSHHLKVLKDLKLLKSKREGTKIIYSRDENVINEYQKLLTNIIKK